MNDNHDLLGAYCTDALDADERAAFEEHLGHLRRVPRRGCGLP